ncbi:MAG: Ig-like domain-containing protein [Nitrospirota bacterium]
MKRLMLTVLIAGLLVAVAAIGNVFGATPDDQPPVVVKTIPESGSRNVDPSLTEIRVTFSKEMMDKSWSWVQIAPENFPKIVGSPRYLEDRKTCVIDVQLEPGKTYIIWLNTQKFTNFKDAGGRPARPYLLIFDTTEI